VSLPYFAYGTTQQGFTHHRRLGLGAPVGRYRTVTPHAVVVPHRAACSNPGCEYVHRMAALVPGLELRVEGDLFLVGEDAAAAVEALEVGAYVPGEIEAAPVGGGATVRARAYLAREPARWRALVSRGDADALASYPRELAAAEARKDCCVRAPGHPPPHDVLSPFPSA
jgi:Gamma-glutamyl cyclotransferase, AIG2-like